MGINTLVIHNLLIKVFILVAFIKCFSDYNLNLI